MKDEETPGRWPLRTAAAVILALAVSSCAMTANNDAKAMRGQPIDAAIQRFGYPSDEQIIAGRHIYTWRRSNAVAGNQMHCHIIIEVADGVIVNHEMRGQLGACNRF